MVTPVGTGAAEAECEIWIRVYETQKASMLVVVGYGGGEGRESQDGPHQLWSLPSSQSVSTQNSN